MFLSYFRNLLFIFSSISASFCHIFCIVSMFSLGHLLVTQSEKSHITVPSGSITGTLFTPFDEVVALRMNTLGVCTRAAVSVVNSWALLPDFIV